jgi:hypothetical protein
MIFDSSFLSFAAVDAQRILTFKRHNAGALSDEFSRSHAPRGNAVSTRRVE